MPNFRDLPGIDALLSSPGVAAVAAEYGLQTVKDELRRLQARWRKTGDLPEWLADPAAYASYLTENLAPAEYRAVFNLTGTIIHTNLGRAPLSKTIYRAIEPLVTRPVTLEYDLHGGKRGDRDEVVAQRLRGLCGAEDATVVNNNAAALMLCLNSLALGAEVPVSRGELIEIGGSFRLPELMQRAGCRLREVGTTNRTHSKDYRAAITDKTTMLLKVHPSNYHIEGFTHEVSIREMAALAHEHDLPLCVDLGSGTLVDLTRWGLPHEPMPQEVLAQGADLVTFSGDKLLGSLQAGIIVGKRRYIEQIKRNPMKRALRSDKLTLAYLAETLRCYEDPDTLPAHVPILALLTIPLDELTQRGHVLLEALTPVLPGYELTIVDSDCQLGSGSLPDQRIASKALRIGHPQGRLIRQLAASLRNLSTPVIGRINQDALWLDLRGADPLEELADALRTVNP
jgi:L-seryl-tRNA(Ser) seleniumtransferase